MKSADENDQVSHGQQLAKELVDIVKELADSQVVELLGGGVMNDLLLAILDPRDVQKHPNIAEFLFANKGRATLLALMRHAITNNYSFKVEQGDRRVGYVSPYFLQWFDDGVQFLEGEKPFSGFLGLYTDGTARYGVAARDVRPGEEMGPEAFEFITIEEFQERLQTIPPTQVTNLEEPVQKLRKLLTEGIEAESEYQELMSSYPWVFGAQYSSIQSHTSLDDENVPDFSAVRTRDNFRDIIEIKSPFQKLFRRDGDFALAFNRAWNQTERYLGFAREHKDYLRSKGLHFDNPLAYLLIGHGVSEEELKKIRTKERLVPGITVFTYDHLLTYMEKTVEFIRGLKAKSEPHRV